MYGLSKYNITYLCRVENGCHFPVLMREKKMCQITSVVSHQALRTEILECMGASSECSSANFGHVSLIWLVLRKLTSLECLYYHPQYSGLTDIWSPFKCLRDID